MFQIKLTLRKIGKTKIVLSLSFIFRTLLFLCAAVILASILFVQDGSNSNILAIVLCSICFTAGFYQDKWIFDADKNIVTSYFGLLFFFKKLEFSMDTVESLEITVIKKKIFKSRDLGVPSNKGGKLQTLSIIAKNSGKKIIEYDSNMESLIRKAEIITNLCSVKLNIKY